MTNATTRSRRAEAWLKRLGLAHEHLIGVRFAINVAIASAIVWYTLQAVGDNKPIWAIASMVAASDPEPVEARRMFKSRLINVAVGSVTGLAFLLIGGPRGLTLPIALAVTVLISTYVVRIKTMWRQAPITAAVVIAAAATEGNAVGLEQGLHKIGEVVFGCMVGLCVSLALSKVWLIQADKT